MSGGTPGHRAVPAEVAVRVLDAIDALLVVLDPKGRVMVWNQECEEVTGHLAVSTLGKKLWLVGEIDGDLLRDAVEEVRLGRPLATVETRWQRWGGREVVIRWTFKPLRPDTSRTPVIIGTGAVVPDVEQIFEASTDLVAQCDPNGGIHYLNSAALEVLGRRPARIDDALDPESARAFREEVLPQLREEGVWRGEMMVVARDGGKTPVSQLFVTHRGRSGGIERISMVARDIREAKELQHELSHRAFHDPLTGLANRALLHDRLAHGLRRLVRNGASLAVLFLDLDYFKAINDQLGHDGGDELLRLAAQRIQSAVRPADTVARLGGDEFVVLAEGAGAREALRIAERVRSALARPFTVAGQSVHSSGSIGVAVTTDGTLEGETLLSQADRASYRAKERGRNRSEMYRPDAPPG